MPYKSIESVGVASSLENEFRMSFFCGNRQASREDQENSNAGPKERKIRQHFCETFIS